MIDYNKYIFIICIFLFGIKSYGQTVQSKGDGMHGIYVSSLGKYLLPEIKGKDTVEIISFVEKPSFDPESAIRIIGNDNHYIIEGRFLKTNHWYENFSRFKNKEEAPIPEIIFYSLPVSDEFTKKMKSAFSKAMKIKDPELSKVVDGIIYIRKDADGTRYNLRINESGSIISKEISNPMKDDGRYNLIMSCSQMAKEIKNQSFNEAKFRDILNALCE